jgi:Fe-S cluster biogenesis protein NfuA
LKIINREYTSDEQKISDILNEYVAPAVENDGGKISLIEYDQENKTARMLFKVLAAVVLLPQQR